MGQSLLAQFESILDGMSSILQDLIECLRAERESIITLDLEQLKKIYLEKHDKLKQLEVLESACSELSRALSFSLGSQTELSIAAIIERIDDDDVAARLDHKLSCIRSIASAVEEFNHSQRNYLTHSLNSVETSLMLLDRLQGKGLAKCYNDQGLFDGDGAPRGQSSLNKNF